MKFIKKNYKAFFIKRLNRFEALVLLNNEEVLVHVPNTGRCRELLTEGAVVIIEDRENSTRKTKFELILVYKDNQLVSIDSQLPNKLVAESIKKANILELREYGYIKGEVTYNNSRFDLFLKKDQNTMKKQECCFVEIKGVTLERNGIAMFPDAPTERGTKHIYELIKAKEEGYRAVIFFVVQLESVEVFTPNKEMDDKFYQALIQAEKSGVELLAYKCKLSETEILIVEKIPVNL